MTAILRIKGPEGTRGGILGTPPDVRNGVRVWSIPDGTTPEQLDELKKAIMDEWNQDPKIAGKTLTEHDFNLREYYEWPAFPYWIMPKVETNIEFSRRLVDALEFRGNKPVAARNAFSDEVPSTFGFHIPENLKPRIESIARKFGVSQAGDPAAQLRAVCRTIAQRCNCTETDVLLDLLPQK